MKKPFTNIHYLFRFLSLLFCLVILAGSPLPGEVHRVLEVNAPASFPQQILYPGDTAELLPGKLRIEQSIQQTDTNLFEVTMNVDTSAKIKNFVSGSYASAVLVIDNCYLTMMETDTNQDGTVLPKLKQAALTFVDEFLAQGASNEIAVITTGTPVSIVQDMTNDSTVLKQKIASIKPADSNFIQDAYQKARDLLNGSSTHNENKYIISVCSCYPMLSYEGTSAVSAKDIIPDNPFGSHFKINRFDYSKIRGWGYSFILGDAVPEVAPEDQLYQVGDYVVSDHMVPTISEAKLAQKEDGIFVYSIYFDHPERMAANKITTRATRFALRNIASGSSYYEATDVPALEAIFTSLAGKISVQSAPWSVSASLAKYMDFKEFSTAQAASGAVYDSSSKMIYWDLLHSAAVPEILSSAASPYQYRYHLLYTVTLDTSQTSFISGSPYPTHESASLTYTFSDQLSMTQTPPQIQGNSFPIPQITGYRDPTILVGASDLVSYTGGISLNTNPFPNPQFTFEGFQGGDTIETIDFYVNGTIYDPDDDPHHFEVPFEEVFYYVLGDGSISDTPSLNDEKNGTYHIVVNPLNGAHITARGRKTGINYRVEYGTGTLFVRATSTNLDRSIVTQLPGEPVSPVTVPSVLIDNNNKIIDSTGKPFSGNQVSLLSDYILETMTKKVMEARLQYNPETSGMEYGYFYMDLVDFEDGNHVLTSSEEVEVYLPYPEGTDSSSDFVVMQLPGINRQFDYNVPSAKPNWITPEKTPNGLKMSLAGFSPFAIAYQTTDREPTFSEAPSGEENSEDSAGTEALPVALPAQAAKVQPKTSNTKQQPPQTQETVQANEPEDLPPDLPSEPEPAPSLQPEETPGVTQLPEEVKVESSSGKTGLYWLLALVILLFICIGGLLWYYRSRQDSD